jgi:choline dehydrogenase-like flavoprotein
VYDDEIVGWKGVIQGYQVHEFIDEGIIMATSFIPPSLLGPTFPQIGRELGELMSDFNRMITAGVLIEDSTSGTVRRGPGGQAIMRYQLTKPDFDKLIRGVALLCEIYFASGASKVYLPIEGLPEIRSADDIRKLFDYQLDPAELEVVTMHAMGTARLSDSPERGAVSPEGELWGHPGLYVADASIFPTPIGVNPQETVMALATRVAWGVADSLRA